MLWKNGFHLWIFVKNLLAEKCKILRDLAMKFFWLSTVVWDFPIDIHKRNRADIQKGLVS